MHVQPVENSTWSDVITQIASFLFDVPLLESAVHSRVTGDLSTFTRMAAACQVPSRVKVPTCIS